MEILYSDKFRKQYDKAPKPVRGALNQRMLLFKKDPFHPFLHNHLLVGEYAGYRSINITGDWRAIYFQSTDSLGKTVVRFRFLGTHSQLYR